ncbi:GNAT family N-acetyltransferase [Thioalkalivibrio sp. ALE20]|uniref:GNAT family N-acetyltransferase n=1 Tax=Thioalkalivibrio sp. ALE20 TaxID=545275 RepID=UPI000375FE03|nr:GNAT family N-acetyltransferase [Thioalkalivibrio sp. ALE20]
MSDSSLHATHSADPGYEWRVASDREELRAAQRLRFRIAAEHRGRCLPARLAGLDRDPLDAWGHHLLVFARGTREPVACARLLVEETVAAAGGFPGLEDFDLGPLMALSGRGAELDRVRFLPGFEEREAAVAALWRGVTRLLESLDCRYLIARTSLPLDRHTPASLAWLRNFRRTPSRCRVSPRKPLPNALTIWHGMPSAEGLPPLARSWLAFGAKVAGEPSHDVSGDAASLLMLLRRADIPARFRSAEPWHSGAGSDAAGPGRFASGEW